MACSLLGEVRLQPCSQSPQRLTVLQSRK
uniref:Uncharacterized protein n=1 Tax=Anguilla anguilla TaxID=7936 RepID=A0A0E9Q8R3_ANGAN